MSNPMDNPMDNPMSPTPKFSVLHTTARPSAWGRSYMEWMRAAHHPEAIEYVLCVDERWGFPPTVGEVLEHIPYLRARITVLYNRQRKCMVDGYNIAASAATGEVLILNSDDMRPPHHWDDLLLAAMGERCGLSDDFVIQVSSGTPADTRSLMVLQILSALRYQRLGYVMYPGYESMYADDDFSEHARADGVVIDARHLMFPHRHPDMALGVAGDNLDAVYRHQNRQESYELGSRLLGLRRSMGFSTSPAPLIPPAPAPPPARQKTIAVCTPGDVFSGVWLGNFLTLFAQLINEGYTIQCFLNYSSNVYITRRCILEGIQRLSPPPDYVLWIDDDNTPNWGHISGLIADLEAYPQADIVTGWCWIQPDGYEIRPLTSCGYLGEGNSGNHITEAALRKADGLLLIDFSGFPTMLMRGKVATSLPVSAFDPLPAPGSRWGFTGEDVSFCINAAKAGFKCFVDSRFEIPHYKLRPARPDMPGALKAQEVGDAA